MPARDSRPLERGPLRVLPLRVTFACLAVMVGASAAALLYLWPIAEGSPALKIDAFKTGLSVGAGAGGACALVLALRRQRLSERTQAHAEEVARATQDHAQPIGWRLEAVTDTTARLTRVKPVVIGIAAYPADDTGVTAAVSAEGQ